MKNQVSQPIGEMEEHDPEIDRMPFEQAIGELETIVSQLERGDVPLEESVKIYERGQMLKRRCEALLKLAESRVEKITLDASGRPASAEPLEPTQ